MKRPLLLIILLAGYWNIGSAQTDSSYYTVRLSAFETSVSNNIAKLYWKTTCFLQYANFQIQKSVDGINFTTTNSFTADQLRCQQPFEFFDSTITNYGSIYYRINVGNIDGRFYHSAIRRVYLLAKGFEIISVYPTITNSTVSFNLSTSERAICQARIINQNGIPVKWMQLQVPQGLFIYSFQTGDLPRGYYWLQVINEKEEVETKSFLRQ